MIEINGNGHTSNDWNSFQRSHKVRIIANIASLQ
jgi:hypothetical protein